MRGQFCQPETHAMFRALIIVNILLWFIIAYGRTYDQTEHDEQEVLLRHANEEIGLPQVRNFEERRMLKKIIEMRDHPIKTISYLVDKDGHLHKFCDSVGYGIAAATQYTNPEQVVSGATIQEADPHGLFDSQSALGMWIMCVDPASQEQAVVFVAPPVVISPFPVATK